MRLEQLRDHFKLVGHRREGRFGKLAGQAYGVRHVRELVQVVARLIDHIHDAAALGRNRRPRHHFGAVRQNAIAQELGRTHTRVLHLLAECAPLLMVQARADWLAKRRGKLFSAPARRLSARIAIVRAHRKASRCVLDGSVFRIYGAFYIASRGWTLVQKVATCSRRAA